MKRILSLILVLVMVLGVMPMVSASSEHVGHDASLAGTWMWVDDSSLEGYQAATCTVDGVMPQKCSFAGCTATSSRAIEAGHSYSATGTVKTAATCKKAGEMEYTCTNCGEKKIEPIAIDPNAHNYDATNKCINTDGTEGATPCGHVRPTALSVTESLSLKVGGVGSIVATLTPADSAATYSYSGYDTAIVSVSAAGVVTGLKKGSTSITVTASTGASDSCTVTVTDGAEIVCANIETTGNSAVIAPTLKVNGLTRNATFKFVVTGGSTYTGSALTLDKDDEGIVKVTVSVSSFTGTDGNAGDTSAVAPITVYVSFYETKTADVKIRTGVQSFMFDDTNVFSSVKIDGETRSNPSSYSVMKLWNCSEDWYNIELSQDDPNSKIASISYPGSAHNAFDSYGTNMYSLLNLDGLKFNCLSKGEFELQFEQYDTATGLTVQSGYITFEVVDASSSITYSTTYTKEVTFKTSDFTKFWNEFYPKEDPDYVVFKEYPDLGDLYIDEDMETKVHASSDKFYFSGKTDLLSDVTFDPEGLKSAYEVEIPFAIYGEGDGEVSGILTIKVGDQVSFTDVKKTDYFYDAVEWAVNKGVTSGTSATTFSPAKTCTRAEVVTFLWRAAGEPAVTGYLPFTDVDDDAYYYDAVLWAYKNDITTGLTSTTFGPHSTVTRGQVVTFLWRAMDELSVSASNPFNDVKRTDYFYEAVLWAVKNDVTTGLTSTTFGPNSGCTRGQIVTFLYRAYEGE